MLTHELQLHTTNHLLIYPLLVQTSLLIMETLVEGILLPLVVVVLPSTHITLPKDESVVVVPYPPSTLNDSSIKCVITFSTLLFMLKFDKTYQCEAPLGMQAYFSALSQQLDGNWYPRTLVLPTTSHLIWLI